MVTVGVFAEEGVPVGVGVLVRVGVFVGVGVWVGAGVLEGPEVGVRVGVGVIGVGVLVGEKHKLFDDPFDGMDKHQISPTFDQL